MLHSVNDNNDLVSYMERSEKEGVKWLCSDKAEIHSKNINQIIIRHIQVPYSINAKIDVNFDTRKNPAGSQKIKNTYC